MKKNALGGFLLICAVLFAGSCYKTGEVIYQPTCKPLDVSINNPQYNYLNNLRREFFQASFTYDINRRLVSSTSLLLGSPERRYDFIYDANNNLIRINTFDIRPGQPSIPIIFITFSYPAGTKSSISAKLDYQFNFLNNDLVTYSSEPLLTYNFNTEFQLVSVYQGSTLNEILKYDVGGNCLSDSLYSNLGTVNTYYVYASYDSKINPARADRSIQLFLQMYSKNNPTDAKRFVRGLGGSGSGFGILYSTSGSYTYNPQGYPLTYNGNFYADYDCADPTMIPAPVIK